ncbi:hypothetical protein NKJ88_21450 [Mesorhizobium sp. M0016]|uniref:hypothetical protein n=1 Tax=Mesorhizobium sp. M0016 TaxID=2956843 RepID=UPI00333D5439
MSVSGVRLPQFPDAAKQLFVMAIPIDHHDRAPSLVEAMIHKSEVATQRKLPIRV